MMMATLEDVSEDESGDRFYEWDDGAEYPSVTTILKADPEKREKMKNWKQSHPNPIEYRDRQGQLGRLVHRRVLNQYSIRELPPEKLDYSLIDEDFEADVETAVAMWDTAPIDVGDDPRVEVAVRSDEHRYSGRFDLLTTDGVLCDLKISKTVHDSYRMQIAAYWRALSEMDGYTEPNEAAIIRLNPDPATNQNMTPKVERIGKQQAERLFNKFLQIQEIYRGER